MLYKLIVEYMSKHNISELKMYIEFLEKELHSKMTKLLIGRYVFIILILSLISELIYNIYSGNNDILFLSILLMLIILLIIILSNVNNKIHYVLMLTELTCEIDDKIPMLNMSIKTNKHIREKFILNFNKYLSSLSSYVNLTQAETFKRFEQHQIHNLI